jgi:hypothetical protein
MGTPANLFASVIFSTIGLAAFTYAKKAGYIYPMLFGVVLMTYPYFVSQTWLLYAVGVALTGLLVHFHDR